MTPDSTTRPRIDEDDDDEECEAEGKGKDLANFLGKGLLEQRIIMVAKPVDRELAASVVSQLLIMDAQDSTKPITMYVNCPGGDADSGFGIYDAMNFIKAPVTTVCLGLAASAAVIIFVGGEDGKRFTLPHSRFLIHQPSSFSQGQASDIEITANEIIKTRDLYNKILAEKSHRTEKQILKDVSRDFWLSADEAVEYGLASSIIKSMSELTKA
ncbi:MAG: ATP-dependent Clp protease proteolytic subunit [Planctomycetota bacterium]|jgi:ATP-dependent Clp protease protease subunit